MRHDWSTSAKISRDLRQRLDSPSVPAGLPVIVRYRPEARPKSAKALGLEISHAYQVLPAVAARLSLEQLGSLVDDDDVERIWLDFRVHVVLDKAAPAIGAHRAWESGITGRSVTVAVLDTGIDSEHPDFGDRVLAARNCMSQSAAAGSVQSGIQSWTDRNGHGTHVAGIIAGDGKASGGRYRGVAPEASLLVAKVLDDDGVGQASDVIAGLEWAFAKGAQVVCLSLGGDESGDGTDALSLACDEFVERGLVICVAAGNGGPRPYTVGPPGCARQVITVGAADLSSGQLASVPIATFSSRGPTSDQRQKPDIAFPGVGIASCRALEGHMGDPVEGAAEYYVRASGTSMATPFAAGMAALLLQVDSEATPAVVKRVMCESARSLGLDANAQGSGLADIGHALEQLGSAPAGELQQRRGCLPGAAALSHRTTPAMAARTADKP